MKYFSFILANLRRKKLRTMLTMLSIVIAFILYAYLMTIKTAFGAGVSLAGADRIIIRHKVSLIQLLPYSYLKRIERIPGIDNVMHQTWFGGYYQEPANLFGVVPVEIDDWLDLYPEFGLPPDQVTAWRRTKSGAVIGRVLADRFDFKIGDRIPLQADIWWPKNGASTWEFDVVGIFEPLKEAADTGGMFFRYDFFDESRRGRRGEIGWFVARVSNPDEAADIAYAVDQEFANSTAETKTETEGAFVQGFVNQIGNIGAILSAVMTVVFFTILLVCGNAMAQSVRERTAELAVLKSLGFSNVAVMAMVLTESLLIAGLGGGVGLGLGAFLISLGDPTGGLFPIFFLPPPDLLVGVGLVVLLGVLSGLFPAVYALRLRIADALRR